MYACTGASPSPFAICGFPPERSRGFDAAPRAEPARGVADFAGLRAGFVDLLAGFVDLLAGFVGLLAGFVGLLAGFVGLLACFVDLEVAVRFFAAIESATSVRGRRVKRIVRERHRSADSGIVAERGRYDKIANAPGRQRR